MKSSWRYTILISDSETTSVWTDDYKKYNMLFQKYLFMNTFCICQMKSNALKDEHGIFDEVVRLAFLG